MKVLPKYGENIIVGVVYLSHFSWYVADRDYWMLDLEKRKDDFVKNGFEYDLDSLSVDRFNMAIVDEESAADYLSFLQPYQVGTSQLRELILNKQYEDTILSLNPSLYINFDQKILFSSYPEILPFERYVPDGWIGQYQAFAKYIPDIDQYWLVNQVDVIKDIYDEEVKSFFEDTKDV